MAVPIIAGAVKAAVGQVLAKRLGKDVAAAVTAEASKEIVERVVGDPVLRNEMNAESPAQSRVVWGSVVAALGVVVPLAARIFGFDISGDQVVELVGAIVTLGGAGYALYGRLRSGLRPLFAGRG